MTSYPGLHPSGFIEFDDPYTGPLLYRSQPSREKTYGPTLSDFMNKYVNQTITNYSFITTLSYLKYFVKHWNKLPKETKHELVELLQKSQSPISKDLKPSPVVNNVVEAFGEEETGNGNSKKMSIAVIVIVAIVAMALGYLVCFATK